MSTPQKFRKKPVVIEAVRFDGSATTCLAIRRWMAGREWVQPSITTRDLRPMKIETLEGTMTAQPGDFIIKGVQGEFYPVKSDIFEATYELVGDPS